MVKNIQNLAALAVMLGGEQTAVGLERVMDGLCPDCASSEHDTNNRCFNYVSPEELEAHKSEGDSK